MLYSPISSGAARKATHWVSTAGLSPQPQVKAKLFEQEKQSTDRGKQLKATRS